MNRFPSRARAVGTLGASAFFCGAALAAPKTTAALTFRVVGAVDKPGQWSGARLRLEFAGQLQTISFVSKGEKNTALVVPLLAVLRAAKPKGDPQSKHPEVHLLAIARGRDGYTVPFSFAELLPDFGHERVYLALETNGKPLSEKEAPVRLLVPDDERGARSLYGLASVSVVDAATVSP